MHNLALALHDLGHNVTGSDDAIHDPSRSRLQASGLLPDPMGWHTDRIHTGIDVVILGMHARQDNPELERANALNIKVVSYPEYLYDVAKNQRRIVVGGSHGKTTITAMLLHVLDQLGRQTDFMVGAQLAGFDRMVQLTGASDILLEGDEYLSSPLDLTPKFHWYRPHLTILTGVAWDHINVFPDPENYRLQFVTYLLRMEQGGSVVWFEGDAELRKVMNEVLPQRPDLVSVPYNAPQHSIVDGTLTLHLESGLHPLVPLVHTTHSTPSVQWNCARSGAFRTPNSSKLYRALQVPQADWNANWTSPFQPETAPYFATSHTRPLKSKPQRIQSKANSLKES